MEFVTKDPSGDEWHYRDGRYYRLNGSQVRSHIGGEYLPDPFKLWLGRSRKAGFVNCVPEFRPTETAFVLFHHWQEVKNADHNN